MESKGSTMVGNHETMWRLSVEWTYSCCCFHCTPYSVTGLLPGLTGLPSRKTSIMIRSRNGFLKVVHCVRFKETKTGRSENGTFPLAMPIIKKLFIFQIHSNIGNWTSLTPENENHNVNYLRYRKASGMEEMNLAKLVEKVGNQELRVSVD